jgi:hypothetical protein
MNTYAKMAQQVISEEAKKAKQLKEHMAAVQKIRKAKKVSGIMKIPFINKLMKKSSLSGLSGFGGFGAATKGLTTWTKVKKFMYLGIIGVSFGAIKYYTGRYKEKLKHSTDPEYRAIKAALPKVEPPANRVLFSTTALVSAPLALSLVTDSEWKITTWICYLAALAYAIKELGPLFYGMLVDTGELKVAKKKAKKKKMARNIAEKRSYLRYFD